MQLLIHSNASYLSVAQARIRTRGVHFLNKGPPDPDNQEDFFPTYTNILPIVCKIMHNIMASAAEDEYGTIFVNNQASVPIRTTLSKMEWKQGPMGIQVENSTVLGITTKEFCQKKSKAMDMGFYWINRRIKQVKFRLF